MSETKRLFPGVTQSYLDKQEQKLVKDQERQEKLQLKARKSNKRAELLQKYGVNAELYAKERRDAIKGAVFGGAMGVAFWLCLSFYVNGFIDAFQGKDAGSQKWVKSVVNPVVDGKFQPTATWYRQIAFLIISVCVTIGISRAYGKDYVADKEIVDAGDMMTGLKELGEKYNLNTHQVKRLVRVVPHIIQRLSEEDRVYFDMLMDGKINIKNNKTFMDMAVAIMVGHLDSHPKDAQLILDTFDERTLPDNLLFQCKIWAERAR